MHRTSWNTAVKNSANVGRSESLVTTIAVGEDPLGRVPRTFGTWLNNLANWPVWTGMIIAPTAIIPTTVTRPNTVAGVISPRPTVVRVVVTKYIAMCHGMRSTTCKSQRGSMFIKLPHKYPSPFYVSAPWLWQRDEQKRFKWSSQAHMMELSYVYKGFICISLAMTRAYSFRTYPIEPDIS